TPGCPAAKPETTAGPNCLLVASEQRYHFLRKHGSREDQFCANLIGTCPAQSKSFRGVMGVVSRRNMLRGGAAAGAALGVGGFTMGQAAAQNPGAPAPPRRNPSMMGVPFEARETARI